MRYDGGELERGERCAVGAGDGAGAATRSSRACENYDWTPWQAGETVCQTRRVFHSAVFCLCSAGIGSADDTSDTLRGAKAM